MPAKSSRPPKLEDKASTTDLPEKIDLTDAHAIKHKLDSTAVDVSGDLLLHSIMAWLRTSLRTVRRFACMQVIKMAGYVEDHIVSNVKITLGLLA